MSKWCLKCNKQPYFNLEGENKGLYCNEHKLVNMVDIRMNKLVEEINHQTKRIQNEENKELVEIKKLFYDK